MTTANMKVVIVNVTMEDELNLPKQKLEAGEFIVVRVVELSKLHEVLRGAPIYIHSSDLTVMKFTHQNTLKRSGG